MKVTELELRRRIRMELLKEYRSAASDYQPFTFASCKVDLPKRFIKGEENEKLAEKTATFFVTQPATGIANNEVYETIVSQDTSAPQINNNVDVIEEDVNEEKDLNININNNIDVKVENDNMSDSNNNILIISIAVPLSILSILGIIWKIYKSLKKRKLNFRNKTKATSLKATAPPPVVVGNSIPAYNPEYK